ncbi:hypothetical protein ACQB60_35040 [Actinomycetota bacterium Odt1-20B]
MRTARLIAASAATLALTAGAVGAAHAAEAPASGDSRSTLAGGTKDEKQWHITGADGADYGFVEWDDYKGSDDRDNFRVRDSHPNWTSIQLRVYWKGHTYKKHAYSGATKTLGIGDVKKGQKVKFRACGYNDGHKIGCSAKATVTE